MNQESILNRSADIVQEIYEIHLQGILDPCWSEWFECSNLTYTENETILLCVIQDQTGLHGLLAKIRDMNLKLISVKCIEHVSDEGAVVSHEDKKQ